MKMAAHDEPLTKPLVLLCNCVTNLRMDNDKRSRVKLKGTTYTPFPIQDPLKSSEILFPYQFLQSHDIMQKNILEFPSLSLANYRLGVFAHPKYLLFAQFKLPHLIASENVHLGC